MKDYSVSKIKSKFGCGQFEQLEGSSFYLERGSIIHSIFENKNDYNKEYSVYKGNKRYYSFQHNFKEYEDIVRLTEINYPQYFEGKWNIENDFSIEINDKLIGHINLTGIMDKYRVDGNIGTIVDWKTGTTSADPTNHLDTLQAYYYIYLLSCKYPNLTKISFHFVYVEQFKEITIETEINMDIKNKLFNYLKCFIYVASLTDENTYRVTKSCSYCNKVSNCPLINSKLDELNLDNNNLDINKIRLYRNIINSIYEIKKNEIMNNVEPSEIKTTNYYYINKNEIPDNILLGLISDNLKINKEQAKTLSSIGYNVEVKTSKSLK